MSEEKITTEEAKPVLVNGEEVSEGLIQQELQMLRERYSQEMSYTEMDEKAAKIESDARENAVERVLLMQKAREEIEELRPEEVEARFLALQEQHGGSDEFNKRFELTGDDVKKIKDDIADGVRLEKYFEKICAGVERPVEADSRAYYAAHEENFRIPESVHAAHIVQHPSPELPLERVNADLLNALERLKKGEDFEALAKEFSHCDDGQHDLGWFGRGQMVPSFEEVAFSTPAGACSDIFQTEFGYHILKVYEYKPAETRPYDEVRYDIESLLYDERKNEAIGAVADALRAEAKIENLVIVEE
ncbi:peptidylprolyl isomerase [Pontiella agarivorans]|uniref:Peptidylprolyl isomerase n=1 Tax=Pontiella agarivorans TaxID=3038953 RepID=A0ABU5MSR5_9BACT|nr:peptidylprolyl isomerase [Pontiella agarivorans]MDZ8117172.1 peptidylprolyl isomerase [Pontiella agarivorans]